MCLFQGQPDAMKAVVLEGSPKAPLSEGLVSYMGCRAGTYGPYGRAL